MRTAHWIGITTFLLAGILSSGALAEETDSNAQPETTSENAVEEKTYNPEEWKASVQEAREQLDLLSLFALATSVGGATIKIPKELQRVPLEMMEGTEALRKRDIKIYLKEVSFKDAAFDHTEEPVWLKDHPAIASLLRFANIAFKADVKTRVGTVPVGGIFRNGRLPFDFDLQSEGYALNIIPDRRKEEAVMDDVTLDLGGPITSGILSKVFGKKAAQLVLEAAMGQTLKMNRDGLLGGGDIEKLLGTGSKTLQKPAVKGLLDSLLK